MTTQRLPQLASVQGLGKLPKIHIADKRNRGARNGQHQARTISSHDTYALPADEPAWKKQKTLNGTKVVAPSAKPAAKSKGEKTTGSQKKPLAITTSVKSSRAAATQGIRQSGRLQGRPATKPEGLQKTAGRRTSSIRGKGGRPTLSGHGQADLHLKPELETEGQAIERHINQVSPRIAGDTQDTALVVSVTVGAQEEGNDDDASHKDAYPHNVQFSSPSSLRSLSHAISGPQVIGEACNDTAHHSPRHGVQTQLTSMLPQTATKHFQIEQPGQTTGATVQDSVFELLAESKGSASPPHQEKKNSTGHSQEQMDDDSLSEDDCNNDGTENQSSMLNDTEPQAGQPHPTHNAPPTSKQNVTQADHSGMRSAATSRDFAPVNLDEDSQPPEITCSNEEAQISMLRGLPTPKDPVTSSITVPRPDLQINSTSARISASGNLDCYQHHDVIPAKGGRVTSDSNSDRDRLREDVLPLINQCIENKVLPEIRALQTELGRLIQPMSPGTHNGIVALSQPLVQTKGLTEATSGPSGDSAARNFPSEPRTNPTRPSNAENATSTSRKRRFPPKVNNSDDSDSSESSDDGSSVDGSTVVEDEDVKRRAWTSSLKDHQRTVFEELQTISKALTQGLINKEVAIENICAQFRADGGALIRAMHTEQMASIEQYGRTIKDVRLRMTSGLSGALKEITGNVSASDSSTFGGAGARTDKTAKAKLDAIMAAC
ncbi:Hypothetical protein D9617_18g034790 [Elsinoe fawcettii]|nr:Hypothetical protein D9617_18g034790 [Elsinoe fawcettii]